MAETQNILVIEDNEPLAKSLMGWLKSQYAVEAVHTGQHGIAMASREDFQAIILDLGLPDMTGQEVCATIRQNGVTTPILILTANDEVTTRVEALDAGADDYLLKPFYIGELQARLRALVRRKATTIAPNAPLTVADLRLEPGRRSVQRGGTDISLRRKEFDILEYLMRNQGTVVTRSMIINNAWAPGVERWNNTVDVHIKYLRDKIDKPFERRLIKTAYGTGYLIEASV